jgi:hypothetical protein
MLTQIYLSGSQEENVIFLRQLSIIIVEFTIYLILLIKESVKKNLYTTASTQSMCVRARQKHKKDESKRRPWPAGERKYNLSYFSLLISKRQQEMPPTLARGC